MALRTNTILCEFVQDYTSRPTTQDIFKWIFEVLKNITTNFDEKLIGIQNEPNGIYLKFSETQICSEIIRKISESKIKKSDGTITAVKISMAGVGYRRIRIMRLPFEVSPLDIKKALEKYGEIISVEDEYWSNLYAPHATKIKNGNRIVQCIIRENIPSFLMIQGTKALITYEGQQKTCAYCNSPDHLISTCPKRGQSQRISYNRIVTGNYEPLPPIEQNIIENLEEIPQQNYQTEINQPTNTQLSNIPPTQEKDTHKHKLTSTSSENPEASTSGEDTEKNPTRPASKKPKTNQDNSVDNLYQADSEDSDISITDKSMSLLLGFPKLDEPSSTNKIDHIEDETKRILKTFEPMRTWIEKDNTILQIKIGKLANLVAKCQTSKTIIHTIRAAKLDLLNLCELLQNINPLIKNGSKTKATNTKIINTIIAHIETEHSMYADTNDLPSPS